MRISPARNSIKEQGKIEKADLAPEVLIDLYRRMILIRKVEERIVELYPEQEMKCPVHLYIGQEAIAAGVCANLKEDDYVFSTHRSHGHYLAKNGDLKAMIAELYGKKTGCSRGRGGSMHLADPKVGILGTSAIVGGNIPLAVGAALAATMQKTDRVSVAFFGDGGVDEGAFQESISFASLKRLPVIFICENNFYATHSYQMSRQPKDNIFERGEPYGIPGYRVDGNDVIAVYKASKIAVQRAREGQGPSLLECRTYRFKGHVGPECDIELGYRTQEELDSWLCRCPVQRISDYMPTLGNSLRQELDRIAKEIDQQIDEAFRFAQSSPYPEPGELFEDVFERE